RQPGRALHQRGTGLRMVEAVTGVMGFGDNWIEGRAIEGRVHLIGDLDQAAVENSEENWIDRVHFPSSARLPPKRLPRSSISGVPSSAFISLKPNIRSMKGCVVRCWASDA